MKERERMLVVRLSALGDVAMTIPAIYSLAGRYPQLEISVLTRPFFAGLFINRPHNVAVIEAETDGRHKGVAGMPRLMHGLAAYKFDCVADLHNVLRSWQIDAFFMLRGCRVAMIDKQRRGRRKALRQGTPQKNFVSRYMDVFAALGYPVELTFRSLFSSCRPPLPVEVRHPAVGIAPFARYYNKTYPPVLMRRVVSILSAEGYNVYLFGARGAEAGLLNSWQEDIGLCTSYAGRFSIADEMALMSELDCMVTMDSANQHIAALAGTEVLSIWGSTTPACGFYGFAQPEDNALCLGLDCQPCSVAGGRGCPLGTLACLCGIRPQDIVERIKSIVNKK